MLSAIREAVGPDVDLMVDFHGRTWPEQAIRFFEALAPHGILFVEEPVPPGDVSGLARVARAVAPVPVATGERLIGRREFRPVLEAAAAAVLQPDLCHTGGLWEGRKIAAMAETYHVSMAFHNPLGPVSTAAAIHLAFATPNFLLQEHVRSDVPWRDEICSVPFPIVNGRALPARSAWARRRGRRACGGGASVRARGHDALVARRRFGRRLVRRGVVPRESNGLHGAAGA